MKLLITENELIKEFSRLTKQYEQFYWATAWAGESRQFKDLLINENKIKKISVGIHFYQTHPNFISEFLDDNRVRFIMQPAGTFHPKLYLFFDTTDSWEILVGSANFTHQAFTKNTEATILITSKDSNSKDILKSAMELVDNSWNEGEVFTAKKLEYYSITWKNLKSKIKILSGQFGSKERKPKPLHEVSVVNMSWKEFFTKVRNEPHHGIPKRLAVITKSRNLFDKVEHFNQLNEDERKFIAGIPNKLDDNIDWGLFGSMKGSGVFKNRIIKNDKNISEALDQIPFSGQITKLHYVNFITHYSITFPGKFIGTATRLLAMKRPDTFVCLDSKNKSKLCKAFGIIQSQMDYERYWEDIIERIYVSEWWLNAEPKNTTELQVSKARGAFLDSLYYEE